MSEFYIETLGYIAMILVLVSMTFHNQKKLRIVNSLGAIAFLIYGVLINSMPVIALNAAILLANIYYLVKTSSTKPSEHKSKHKSNG